MNSDEWLTEVATEAKKIPRSKEVPRPEVSEHIVGSAGKKYGLGNFLGSSNYFNLYECILEKGCGILKIAKTAEHNVFLDRETLVLESLSQRAYDLEMENTGEGRLNYEYFFPRLLDTFISESKDERRVNILAFPTGTRSLGQWTPLSALYEIEKIRVDPKTGAWILGKVLKVLAFAHSQNISNGLVRGDNILIERDLHGVILFDWTQSGNDLLEHEELSQAAQAVTRALGGNLETGELPPSNQLSDSRFEKYIYDLAKGKETDTSVAHRNFYSLIRDIWPKTFHPYTTHNLEREG